jgi:diguanylate cyclase (GGDEF)-like protein/PAS domain S-box-containing protein
MPSYRSLFSEFCRRGPVLMLWRVGGTIRGRIFLASLMLSAITAILGGYAAIGIATTGQLADKTYDRSLMSINYARAASADFAAIQAAVARARLATDPGERRAQEARVNALVQSFEEDLAIAEERAQSTRAAAESAAAKEALSHWLAARREFGTGPQTADVWQALDAHASVVEQHIDLLINFTAGDGFSYRQAARALVARDVRLSMAATVFAILLSGIIAFLLSRQIVRPVAEASAVATRIAAGDLAVPVPEGGADEFGALLRAMDGMRSNIRAMMQEEVSQRRSAQGLLADAVQGSNEGIVVGDAEGRIVMANARFADLLGLEPEKVAGGNIADARGSVLADTLIAMRTNGTSAVERQAADGRWLRISRSPTRDGGFVAVCSDISRLKKQEDQLKRSNLQLDAALSNMLQGLCLFDAKGGLLVHNRRFCDMFGIEYGTLHPGMRLRAISSVVAAGSAFDDARALELLLEQEDLLRAGASGALCRTIRGDMVVSVRQQPTAEGGWIATYEDVTQRFEAEARIITMARRDALTGLANRMVFSERLEDAAARLENGTGFAILCLDLDRFKEVNDTFGHPVGDALLRGVAERLQACLRETDLLARLGGDEFAIVQSGSRPRADAVALATRLIEMFEQPFHLEDQVVTVGVSVGISLAPEHGSDPDTLLKCADLALYRAKGGGRGGWSFFDEEMDLELRKRRALENDLRHAIANGELEVFFQPIVNLAHHRVSCCEALLRWKHPERGYVSPAEFIPLAEETGAIGAIGEWVLRRACREAANWPDGIGVEVNVSAAQFRNAAVVRAVMEALTESGLPAYRLELEITESVLLTDNVATLATLHTLKRLGVRVAMDDFGTGYSSLSYLQSFPFDKIKIDQSFVRNLDITGSSRLIVRSVVGLGRSLGMTVTAEGIETEAQMEHLRLEGCDEAQGYLFSRPVPAAGIHALFDRLRRQAA